MHSQWCKEPLICVKLRLGDTLNILYVPGC